MAAGRFLNDGLRQAESSGIRVPKSFARLLAAFRRGLLAWYDHPISAGPLEGTNNQIKTLTRQADGFHDQESFTLKILALHHARWRLVGQPLVSPISLAVWVNQIERQGEAGDGI